MLGLRKPFPIKLNGLPSCGIDESLMGASLVLESNTPWLDLPREYGLVAEVLA